MTTTRKLPCGAKTSTNTWTGSIRKRPGTACRLGCWVDVRWRSAGRDRAVPSDARTGRGASRAADASPLLGDLLSHPSVVLGELDSAIAAQVDQRLIAANVFDALAAQVVYIARRLARAQRGSGPPTPRQSCA